MKRTGMVFLCVVVIMSFMLGIFSVPAEAQRKVVMWSFAANNIAEWKEREADIEKKFNIDLDIQQIAENAFMQKLQAVMMAGEDVPDIIEWLVEIGGALNADPELSFVVPLNDYVKDSEVFKKVVPGRIKRVARGDSIYGLPHDVHPVILIYNDTLWKSVGVDVAAIKTWDEFFEEAKKLTAEKKDGKPVHYALPYTDDGLSSTLYMIWQQSGARILDDDGKPNLTNPEFTTVVKRWLDWYQTGAVTNWDWGNFAALLKNGTLASYASPDWWIPQVNDAAAAGEYQFKIRDLPLYEDGGLNTASWGGTFLGIPQGTEDPAFIYQVIEYMQYDKSSVRSRFETTGMIPPFSEVWDDPLFSQPDERFGGQSLGALLVSQAKAQPEMEVGNLMWDVVLEFQKQYSEMVTGKVSVEEGLQLAQEEALKLLDE